MVPQSSRAALCFLIFGTGRREENIFKFAVKPLQSTFKTTSTRDWQICSIPVLALRRKHEIDRDLKVGLDGPATRWAFGISVSTSYSRSQSELSEKTGIRHSRCQVPYSIVVRKSTLYGVQFLDVARHVHTNESNLPSS